MTGKQNKRGEPILTLPIDLRRPLGLLASASLATLRSGHSHEDIDQVFGRLASWMQGRPVAQCPHDFVPLINEFLAEGDFPHEPFRLAFEMNRVRDWNPVIE